MHALSFHASIAGDRLLGPDFIPPSPTGALHHDLLKKKVLRELMQDVDLQTEMHVRGGHPLCFCVWGAKSWTMSTSPLLLTQYTIITTFENFHHFSFNFISNETVMLILSVESIRWFNVLSSYYYVSLKYKALKLKKIQMCIVFSLGETSP